MLTPSFKSRNYFLLALLPFVCCMALPARPCEAEPGVFCADYFANIDLEGEPILTRKEAAIDHEWRGGSPDDAVPADSFSARYQGSFFFEAGTWLFRAVADDGVRLWVDGSLVIDGWKNQAPTQYTSEVTLTEGFYPVRLEYYERGGWASLKLEWTRLYKNLDCSGIQDAFCTAFFDNPDLAGEPRLQTIQPVLDFSWRAESPLPGIGRDGFSIRANGAFFFEAGIYTFTALADDGVRLFVDGAILIDEWRDQSESEFHGSVYLEEGVHELQVAYYERSGQARFKLDWRRQSPDSNETSPLGMNISHLTYYSTEWTLIDAMKSAGGWFTRAEDVWDTKEQDRLDLDEQGWVRSLPAADDASVRYREVSAILLNGTDGKYPAGRYIVLYDGQGELAYGFDAVFNEALSRPGRHVLDVDEPGNGGILLRITATDPENNGEYIRRIRVILPGYRQGPDPFGYTTDDAICADSPDCVSLEGLYESSRFHPKFLADLRRFKVIRFMDFLRTNTSTLTSWEDRPRLEDARWNSENGAPVELVFELSNSLNTDAWLNVPTRADDAYVARFAELALTMLDADRKVYLEYGNEIWNTAFPAGNWVQEQAMQEWPDVKRDAYTKRMNWYAKRASEIIAIWKSVWQDESDRVIGVLGGFAANSWITEQVLDCPLWTAETGDAPCSANADALAIAPYFGGYLGQTRYETQLMPWTRQDSGLDSVFQELGFGGLLIDPLQERAGAPVAHQGALRKTYEWIDQQASLAERHGLDLIAYEAGQHLAGVGSVQQNSAITDLFIQANRDPRMYELYMDYLNEWKARGGGLLCHFLNVGPYNKWGSWGSREHQDQQAAPKFRALMDFISQNPRWW